MSSLESWISVIGSIASIGGAIWAFIEANKASKSASKAEKVKGELVERRKLVEVSQVHAETSRILKTVSTVGPSCNSSLLRGVNCANIAKEVEEYCRYINEQSSHFSDFFDNKAKELCAAVRPNVELLSEAKTFDEKKSAGKTIYYLIDGFMPLVKGLSDEKKENVSVE
ncbi:hypothetical protein ACOCGP_003537 [Vibrio cholerae]|uniref:hypothetical protein n=1 Tax=Vibrio TaxID=662 RepID=UPI000A3B7D67|nr:MULTISPECIES: hypothetical protein [Vibrio]MCR9698715.1 hypothetical protein [Vibrio cholerae]OUD79104.1 putative membrane protein [Vibrio vulnificus]RNE80352.1 hypothetical protein EEJ35_16420 [Vibrio cholerae]HDZ3742337.1 hypothetical protein [Vibrio cholerae]HDZ3764107.1 hypothetical protein [Vibrio cholerae]